MAQYTSPERQIVLITSSPPPQPPPPVTDFASSPFGKLAPEIRNRIYDLTLTRNKPFQIGITSVQLRQGRRKPEITREFRGLLLSCRVISAECAQLFYASNSFIFTGSNRKDSAETFDYFSKKIGAINTAAFRTVTLEVEYMDDFSGRLGFVRTKTVAMFTKVLEHSKTYPDCRFIIYTNFVHHIKRYAVNLCLTIRDGVVQWEQAIKDADAAIAKKKASEEAKWLKQNLDVLRSEVGKAQAQASVAGM